MLGSRREGHQVGAGVDYLCAVLSQLGAQRSALSRRASASSPGASTMVHAGPSVCSSSRVRSNSRRLWRNRNRRCPRPAPHSARTGPHAQTPCNRRRTLTSYATVDTRVARQTAVHNNMERTRISIDEPLPPLHRHPAGRSARLRAAWLFVRRHTPNHRLPEPIRRACGVATKQRAKPRPSPQADHLPGRVPAETCVPPARGTSAPFFAERLVNAGGCVVL
jgi:hypothetical protein